MSISSEDLDLVAMQEKMEDEEREGMGCGVLVKIEKVNLVAGRGKKREED